ncbi:hypothetical protein Tco_0487291 [Tanacetum coccineum]
MLAEAHEAGHILDEEQLAFLADPRIPADQAQTNIPHNATFQTEDLDTYDSDCDDLSTAQAVLMANISKTMILVSQRNAQRINSPWYDGAVISKTHVAMPVIDDEETLILEEEMDVLSELPKVSLLNASLKNLKFHLTQFDSVVKKRTTPSALEEDSVMSVSDESRVTYTEVSSPFEDLSDIGSPRADDHEYLKLPRMPDDPYVEADLQAPPSPDYVPGPEEPEQAPPSPELYSGLEAYLMI